MIKSDTGKLEIMGAEPVVLAEFTGIIRHLYTMLERCHGDEDARKLITECGRLAFMSDEERLEAVSTISDEENARMEKLLKELTKGGEE